MGRASLYNLWFLSCAFKKRVCAFMEKSPEVCLDPVLTDLNLYAALTKKRIISDSRTVIWCADRSCMSYTFEICLREQNKKERRTKSKFSNLIFSTARRVNGTLGVYFTLE